MSVDDIFDLLTSSYTEPLDRQDIADARDVASALESMSRESIQELGAFLFGSATALSVLTLSTALILLENEERTRQSFGMSAKVRARQNSNLRRRTIADILGE